MRAARVAVIAGSAAYVIGGWSGWFDGPVSGFPAVRAHELAGRVAEWSWLGVAVMLAAGLAPFTRGWLRWLWLTALPPLGFAVLVVAYRDSFNAYPFFPSPGAVRWGLVVSIAGAVVALLALLAALRRPTRARRRQLVAPVAVLALSVIVVLVIRGPSDAGAERRLRARIDAGLRRCPPLQRGAAPTHPTIRVECRDRVGRPLQCSYQVDGAGGIGPGVTRYAPSPAC